MRTGWLIMGALMGSALVATAPAAGRVGGAAAGLKHHHHYDRRLEVVAANARKEGERAGVRAAEGFIQHRGESYPQENILKKILGELCVEFP